MLKNRSFLKSYRFLLPLILLLLVFSGCMKKKGFDPLTKDAINNARQTADAAVQYITTSDIVNLYQLYNPSFRESVSLGDYGAQYAENIVPFGKIKNPVYKRYVEKARFFANTIGLQQVLRFYYQIESKYRDTTFMAEVIVSPTNCTLSEINMTSPNIK